MGIIRRRKADQALPLVNLNEHAHRAPLGLNRRVTARYGSAVRAISDRLGARLHRQRGPPTACRHKLLPTASFAAAAAVASSATKCLTSVSTETSRTPAISSCVSPIIDTFTRLSPAIDVRQSYRGADVVATLERAAIETSLPKTIRVDNGPEFVSKELDLWASIRGVAGEFSCSS